MAQLTFSDLEYSRRKKSTRREKFLETMNGLIPWEEWVAAVEPYYPPGHRGRPPMGIEKMLRMYLLQNWFQLSAAAVEETIYDSYAMRSFMGVDFLDSGVPDASTLLKFRRLLDRKGLSAQVSLDLHQRLAASGQILKTGAILDPALVHGSAAAQTAKKSSRETDSDPEIIQLEMA